MTLSYRLHTRADEPALVRFWGEHGGWDKVDEETWAQRLLRSPSGGATIVVGEHPDTGEMLSQFAFIPSLVSVDGREVRAARPFAPILSKAAPRLGLRSANPFAHPVAAMYMFAVKALRERGDGLVYMVPDPRWLRFFRTFPFLDCGSFPLWSLPLPLPDGRPLPLPAGCDAAPVDVHDSRTDALWRRAAAMHGCQVVRDSRTLPWKVGGGDYQITGVTRGGELIGLAASQQKGDRQWLVCDLLAADTGDALTATLAAAANLADAEARRAPPESPVRKVAVLTTPVLAGPAAALGFRRDAYDFPMVVHLLDAGLSRDAVAPARWYVSAND